MKYCRNLGFFAEIWKNFAEIWVFVGQFEFFGFWVRETETDPLESVSSGEDSSSTVGVVGSTGVESDPVSFFGWVESSDEFG